MNTSPRASSPPPTLDDNHSSCGGQDALIPIAIVGFSFRFPEKATSTEEFWDMLMEGRNVSTPFPDDRLNQDSFRHPEMDRQGTLPVSGAHFIEEDIAAFDAPFFSMTHAEAAAVDPQQRGLLETAYRALENAGMGMENILGSETSVHAACFTTDYASLAYKDPEQMPKYTSTGVSAAFVSNRLSWFFDLHGPSVTVDTACSSSMVALDQACRCLRNGQSKMGLVAGCNLLYTPDMTIALGNMGFLSPDGRCYSFDQRANGYARGEGLAVVVLKPLDDAIKDGDTIRAVIRGTGSNQDGRTPGVTQPSKEAQELLIRRVYNEAGLDFANTRYVEAHGTGTSIGDPIEASSIAAAFGHQRRTDEPLYIGSVKSNIGHLEATSGLAGLIKTVLILERGVIPPIADFQTLNAQIDAEFLNIEFLSQSIPWPTTGLRRASVNSFGFGGTNSHAVLEDAYNYLALRGLSGNHSTAQRPPLPQGLAQTQDASSSDPSWDSLATSELGIDKDIYRLPKLLVWSAGDEKALNRMVTSYNRYLHNKIPAGTNDKYLDNLAHTLGLRRSRLPWKAFAVASSFASIRDLAPHTSQPARSTEDPKLAYVFTGQGAQWPTMGRGLLGFSVFKKSLEASERFLKELGSEWSLLEELFKDEKNSSIHQPAFSQPLCTALQIALVDLLRYLGLTPAAVVGHSSGEIAAAYTIGALSYRSALRVAYYRGKLSQEISALSSGQPSMMAVSLSGDSIIPYFRQVEIKYKQIKLYVACVNSPKSITVSGDPIQLEALKEILDEENVPSQKLKVNVPYHSPYMHSVATNYAALIQNLDAGELYESSCVMVSSVTGHLVSYKELQQAEYWVNNMVSKVRFSDAVSFICSNSAKQVQKKLDGNHRKLVVVNDMLEIGPHSALKGPIRDILRSVSRSSNISYNSVLVRNHTATTSLQVLGHLFCFGYPIDLARVNEPNPKESHGQLVLPDLPEYVFDHSKTYWHESRISRCFRFRKYPRIDLLGTPEMDWNPLEAKWHNSIKTSELPWIEDHMVNGSLLYPAAGMIVMAIEAAKQLSEDSSILAYELKDVTFPSALQVSTTPAGVDTQFFLRPLRNSQDKNNNWAEFRVCFLQNGGWVETCRGTIQVKYEEKAENRNSWAQSGNDNGHERQLYDQFTASCRNTIDSEKMYRLLGTCGLQYGPTFQSMQDIRYSNTGEATAKVKTFSLTGKSTNSKVQPHVIHPSTLDGALQVVFAGLQKDGVNDIPTMIPTRIQHLIISHSGLNFSDSKFIEAFTRVNKKTLRTIEASVSAVSSTNDSNYLCIEGLEMQAVATAEILSDISPSARRLCYTTEWKPDLDVMDPQEVARYCRASVEEPDDFYQDVAFVLFAFITNTLEELKVKGVKELDSYLANYLRWMRTQLEKFSNGALPNSRRTWAPLLLDREYQELLIQRIEEANPQGALYVKAGRSLTKVLSGEMDPLEIFFEGDTAKNFYKDVNERASCYTSLNKYLDFLAHKDPGMKILEVGAGTGATTELILESFMTNSTTPRYVQYEFTDISSSFFESARESLGTYPRVNYRILDIEGDITNQGFEAETYDLVVAANVLHATRDLNVTVQNIRKLLRPGGKLVLVEVTKPDLLWVGFAFGLLPGWWLSSEDYRKQSPCISEEKWNETLMNNGFSGTDYIFQDYESPVSHAYSVMISTAVEIDTSPSNKPGVLFIADESSTLCSQLSLNLQTEISQYVDTESRVVSFTQAMSVAPNPDTFFIFLDHDKNPLLKSLNPQGFQNLQVLLQSTRNLLWITGGGGTAPTTADFGGIQGLCRVNREENVILDVITVALENISNVSGYLIQQIGRIIKNKVENFGIAAHEPEYVEMNGTLHINRIVEAQQLNDSLSIKTSKEHRQMQPFGGPIPLQMSIGTAGLLDSLHFRKDNSYLAPIVDHEVEVEVKAIGVNFIDMLVALGRVEATCIGSECAGVVRRVSSTSSFQPGDRVTVSQLDSYKTFVRAQESCVQKIPDDMPFAQAAAIPANFVTVIHSLINVARIQAGETILIHSAAGGTGQVAVQVAQHSGLEVYATVGSEEKKHLIMERYGIPEDHIFSSRDLKFAQGIKIMTNGAGVDVVLNSLSGEGLVLSWECVKPYGRFIEIGKKDIYSRSKLPMWQFSKNITFSGVDLGAMGWQRPDLVGKALESGMALLKAKKARIASPLHEFKLSEIEKAFRFMQSGQNTGKIVLTVNEDDEVPAILDTETTYSFDGNATYVISGGLGGIGRSISRWMVSRGAKHLLLLSRSGPKRQEAIDLVRQLTQAGVQIETPVCDVSDMMSLELALGSFKARMPPIKGCIQASMVLKDSTIENMSFDQWESSVKPKVQGSWNLHAALPHGMDFFVLLSSICGIIGSQGQANYASGNTYQDALARYRVTRGEKATSLDLGIIASEGFLAENKDIMGQLERRTKLRPVSQEQVFALLDYYCDPLLPISTPLKSQVVIGLETPANMYANGYDLPHYLQQPLFRHLHQIDDSSVAVKSAEGQVNYAAQFAAATSLVDAQNIACLYLVKKLSKILSQAEEEIDVEKPMHTYGVDSLLAVELRNMILKDFQADVAIFEILGGATFVMIASLIARRRAEGKSK